MSICVKDLPYRNPYSAKNGQLLFELKNLDRITVKSEGEGNGFYIDTRDPLNLIFTPNSVGSKLLVFIGSDSFSIHSNYYGYRNFVLSQTHPENPEQLRQLPELIKKALGDKVEIRKT